MGSRFDLDELSAMNTIGDYIGLVADRNEKNTEDGHAMITGFGPLDRNVGLIYGRSNLVLVPMAEHGGKSAIIYSVLGALIENGIKAFLYSPSSSESILYDRLFSSMTGISLTKIREGNFNAEEIERIESTARKIENSGLHIIGNRVLDVEDFRDAAIEAREEGECSIVLMDDLDMIDLSSFEYGRVDSEELGKAMKALREIGMPVIATLSYVPELGTKKELMETLSPDGKGPDSIILTKRIVAKDDIRASLIEEQDEIMYFIDEEGTVRQEKVKHHYDTISYTDWEPHLSVEPILDPTDWTDED